MTISVKPQWEDLEIRHEKGVISSATLRYNIFGTNDAVAADTALMSYAAVSLLGNLKRDTISISKIAHNAYEGVVEYRKEDQEEENESNPDSYVYSFDTTGGTQHITQSYQTRGSYAAQGYTAPNHNGAIGVQDGDVAGCDIIVPQLNFSMSQSRRGVISRLFIKQIASITGKINAAPFIGFDTGELLFEGASGNQNFTGDDATFDLTYKFKAMPTVNGLTIGNINVSNKRGWDYLWVQYIEKEDTNSKAINKLPFAAYVESVYEEADFSILLQ
jgi:hypothetical protein